MTEKKETFVQSCIATCKRLGTCSKGKDTRFARQVLQDLLNGNDEDVANEIVDLENETEEEKDSKRHLRLEKRMELLTDLFNCPRQPFMSVEDWEIIRKCRQSNLCNDEADVTILTQSLDKPLEDMFDFIRQKAREPIADFAASRRLAILALGYQQKVLGVPQSSLCVKRTGNHVPLAHQFTICRKEPTSSYVSWDY